MQLHTDRIKIFRTTARILSIALCMLWGAFFVEHLSWFVTESMDTPPTHIWFAQAVHFLLLVGYVVTLRWERIGSMLIVVNAILFFSFAAGKNAIPFIIVSAFPVMLYSYCWIKQRHMTKAV